MLVSDGNMRVGVKKDEAVEKDWSIFDNFRIFYHGEALPGDLNLDGKVNVADIATLINVIAQGTSESRYDVNGDGKVNIADVATIIGIIADGK